MDDNATAHRARIVQVYLQRETIERIDWPARSPDVNPIEHVWDICCKTCKLQYRPVLFNHKVSWSSEQLLRLNGHTTQNRIADLITSMHNRCQGVIAATGHHTRY